MSRLALLGVFAAACVGSQPAFATLYTANYSYGSPPPGFVAGSTSYTEATYGYTFTAAAGGNLNWGQFSGPIGLNINSNLTISRADHHLFSLDSMTIYYAGTTTSGLLDFDVVPFDSGGNEGSPITLGVFGPGINPLSGFPSIASGLSRVTFQFQGGPYKIMALSLTSDVAPTPAPGTAMPLAVAAGWLGLGSRRRGWRRAGPAV